ncbi:hypothetical protein [Longimicrobium sp.]|uniref:hypothetical protein n=1 Tax=Longimicrobium sp. TaxID=2029185 RepID=UPI002F932F81
MQTSTGGAGPGLTEPSRDSYGECDSAALSSRKLAEVTREHGVDSATALLYDRIRNAEPHRAFIEAVDAVDPAAPLPPTSARLLIAPAAFWREYPQIGADGAAVLAVARELGISAERIPTRSTGGVTENARIIREALAKEADGSVILVSLSKGGADVRVALDAGGAPLRKVRAWINVCGLVHGTPLVDQFFAGPWWRRTMVRAFLARHRADFRLIRELGHAPGSPLSARAVAPDGVHLVNVIACPLSEHTSGALATRHRQLAALGPNDGSTLLTDAIVDGGAIYPVWGADHYFRTPDAPNLIRRILLHLGTAGHLPASPAP